VSARDQAIKAAGYAAVSMQPRGIVFDPDVFALALAGAGFAVVPATETSEMCFAGRNALIAHGWRPGDDDEAAGCACPAYRAMLAAGQGNTP
jgi:hypothetical protein